jgi:hypothetical protein
MGDVLCVFQCAASLVTPEARKPLAVAFIAEMEVRTPSQATAVSPVDFTSF